MLESMCSVDFPGRRAGRGGWDAGQRNAYPLEIERTARRADEGPSVFRSKTGIEEGEDLGVVLPIVVRKLYFRPGSPFPAVQIADTRGEGFPFDGVIGFKYLCRGNRCQNPDDDHDPDYFN